MKLSPSPRAFARAGLATSAAALLAFGMAAPAAMADEIYEGSVRAQYVSNHQSGSSVQMDGQSISTSLFTLRLEGGDELIAYCIDIKTSIRSQAWYREGSWNNYDGQGEFAEPGKIHWLLQNGYPEKSAQELADVSDANSARVTEAEALAATQAAIWHFSNGANLTRGPGNVQAIYDHLIEAAEDLPQEPAAALSIDPSSATGTAGETVGEFEISTEATEIPVDLTAPEGVELVDVETGEAVTTVSGGDTVGFSVPEGAEAGEASFSLETGSTVRQGRLFKGEDADNPTQTLITAKSDEVTVSASASASWEASTGGDDGEGEETPSPSPTPSPSEEPTETPAPTPSPSEEPTKPGDDKPTPPAEDDKPTLPVTGGALAGLVAAGVAALAAGGGALYLSRKRKATEV
ncbi:thioester domain-containing protein [Nocardiopsis alba]|uniref:thioester domain-containing protein n=1 Tax=Nocardiopsis alba TaxID=53437 RepID=UPI0033F2C47D